MQTSRIIAIINPAAGKYTDEKAVLNQLKKSYPGITCCIPENSVQLKEKTEQALAEGYSHILAVGGDGTIHQVINGFFDQKGNLINPEAILEIYPLGTANDFVRSIISTGDHPATTDSSKKYDVGYIEVTDTAGKNIRKYFINVCDAGIGARVASRVNAPSFHKRGIFKYLAEALLCAWTFQPQKVTIEIDSKKIDKEVKMIAFANSTTFGDGLQIAPQAHPDDGLLDVVIIGNLNYLTGLRYLWALVRKKTFSHKEIQYYRAKNAAIDTSEKMLIEADGEIIGYTPCRAGICPAKLPIRIQPHHQQIKSGSND